MVERIPSEQEELDEVACDVTSGHVHATREVGQREALVDRADVRDTITTVYHQPSQETCRREMEEREREERWKEERWREERRDRDKERVRGIG